jgi:protein-S-isoprenylcysteine O-methyltransferase Ste14
MVLQEAFEAQGQFLFRYRSYLPLLLLVAGLVTHALLQYDSPVYPLLSEKPSTYVALLVSLLGLAVRVFTVGYTVTNTSGRNTEGQLADALNTTGMYSLVRHPLYLGNYLMWLGIALLPLNVWFSLCFSLVYFLYYERIMYTEEQFLIRKFGERYSTWAARTNAFFPGFAHYQKPDLAFSWKKVLKKEKNGVFALFLTFYLFELVGAYASDPGWTFEPTLMLYLTLVSGVLYLILKIIKKKTAWLNEAGR